MMTKILPLTLMAVPALMAVVSVPLAEPVMLTEAQMDRVTAGADVTNEPGNFRYENGGVIAEVTGLEGLAEYAVAETEGGRALAANVHSTRSQATAATGGEAINVGTGG